MPDANRLVDESLLTFTREGDQIRTRIESPDGDYALIDLGLAEFFARLSEAVGAAEAARHLTHLDLEDDDA